MTYFADIRVVSVADLTGYDITINTTLNQITSTVGATQNSIANQLVAELNTNMSSILRASKLEKDGYLEVLFNPAPSVSPTITSTTNLEYNTGVYAIMPRSAFSGSQENQIYREAFQGQKLAMIISSSPHSRIINSINTQKNIVDISTDINVKTIVISKKPPIYYQRAFDSGTGGLVYWTSENSPNFLPPPITTTPIYTGVLSNYAILRVLNCN